MLRTGVAESSGIPWRFAPDQAGDFLRNRVAESPEYTPIAKALTEAHKRDVKVEVILDKSQRKERYTSATFLKNAGISTYIDDKHAIAHNKVMIIDQQTVITGSFNFTNAAELNNAENLLVIRSKELADIYIRNWNSHKEHSEKYEGK